ncbi:hypothetical protein BZL30_6891 [Mycobacterium kansasii]|uniref:Uncharacterized protein n=1 Tax=Mycobacterium kansasii TaxID=1768 RepID=A0A1V3WSF8_MYCKA|nr:hypothetical protein BZL30_6891 [Mycobacterium kansasii]
MTACPDGFSAHTDAACGRRGAGGRLQPRRHPDRIVVDDGVEHAVRTAPVAAPAPRVCADPTAVPASLSTRDKLASC